MKLILASSSPRRKRILEEIGLDFSVEKAEIDEISGESPREIVLANSRSKAEVVAEKFQNGIVIGADTVVSCRGEILGKPEDRDHARDMIELQIGNKSYIHTGLHLIDVESRKAVHGCEVSAVITKNEGSLESYLDSGLWRGKAGGFGIQDDGSLQVEILWGEFDNVVGLPGKLLLRLLDMMGFRYPDKTPSMPE